AYQEALDIFQALNRPDQEVHLWVNIGQAHLNAGSTAEAMHAFQQVVTLTERLRSQQPNSPLPARLEAAYRGLATLLRQANRGSEAEQVLGLI
ncbi:MAG: tetratricopeptide repeat protein, partial [Cyanobacteria bacterium J06607_10]